MSSLGSSTLNVDNRHSLRLYIDPFTYQSEIRVSPQSTSPSSSSANASNDTASTTPARHFVLCMHDFYSDDPHHLPFVKNDILALVKQEETGWWAAMRSDAEIGWIPKAFVERISEEMADKLQTTQKDLRVYEYQAEKMYVSDPSQRIYEVLGPAAPTPSATHNRRRNGDLPPVYTETPELVHPRSDSELSYRLMDKHQNDQFGISTSSTSSAMRAPYTTPFHNYNSTPYMASLEEDQLQTRSRAGTYPVPITTTRRGDDPVPGNRALYAHSSSGESVESSNLTTRGMFEGLLRRTRSKRWKETSDLDKPQPPRIIQAYHPKPIYANELELDTDGHVRSGTLNALVEKLTYEGSGSDMQRMADDALFRNIFLMSFRSFTTADRLFDMLVETYMMDHLKDLAAAELEEWKGYLIATQRRVLMIFTMWLEDHRLLEHEPHIASKLTEFLQRILEPPLASMARLLVKTINRLTFANSNISPTANSPKKARKSRAHKNDLLRLDPADIAEQLTLLESRRYVKIAPQDCLRYPSKPLQEESNLSIFCSTHDRIVAWVKVSVLSNDALGKRADTIDFWIKVAEKCKAMNNFASMSAIIVSLSSTVLTRLHLTWAHVGRKTALDALLRYNEPNGGFSGYRILLQNVEGPCVPFVVMFLTDLTHIKDFYQDDGERISFLQRQRSYEVITSILRYQARTYEIAESESTMNFIWRHLHEDSSKNNNWFWSRSQEVQQSELAHADIRKGLEAAGF